MKESIAGMTTGVLLVCVSFPFLFWNEGRSVVRSQILGKAQEQLVQLDKAVINPENEKKLVATYGKIISNDSKQTDTEFGVSSKAGDLKLRRTVEMYQWKEKKKESKDNVGGGKTSNYTYEKHWSSHEVDSSDFKKHAEHRNPSFQFKTDVFTSRAKLGEFNLHVQLLGAVSEYKSLNIRKKDITEMPPALETLQRRDSQKKGYGSTSDTAGVRKLHWMGGNELFVGANPKKAQIGDYKLHYAAVQTGQYSVLGQQSGDQLMSFTLEGIKEPELPCLCAVTCCAGAACVKGTASTIDSAVESLIEQNDEETGAQAHINAVRAVEPGKHSGNEMLSILTKRNAWKLMAYRAVGYCLMTFGFYLLVKPLETLFSVIGVLGQVAGWVLFAFCSLLACVASLAVMATAWFYYRPVLAGCLIAAGAGIGYLAIHFLQNHEHIHRHAQALHAKVF